MRVDRKRNTKYYLSGITEMQITWMACNNQTCIYETRNQQQIRFLEEDVPAVLNISPASWSRKSEPNLSALVSIRCPERVAGSRSAEDADAL